MKSREKRSRRSRWSRREKEREQEFNTRKRVWAIIIRPEHEHKERRRGERIAAGSCERWRRRKSCRLFGSYRIKMTEVVRSEEDSHEN